MGEVNENCDDACNALNLQCSEQEFFRNNGDVDSSTEVLSLIQTLGGTLSATSCSGDYEIEADVPNYSTSENILA